MAFAVDAEAQREALRHCEEILEQLECITLSKTTPEYFVKLNIGAKVCPIPLCRVDGLLTIDQLFPLIEDLYKHYPLEDYELEIRKIIKTQLRDQYTDNNLAERPKTLKEFQELSLSQRLALLNAEGAIELAEELCAQLQRYRALERLKANKNVVKAWAKGELRVRNAHEKSVTSLIEWAYYETTLHFEDAEHLYDIWALAKRLGFDQLAQECMNRLVDTTSDSLKHAFSNNIPLSYLIGYGSGNGSPGLPDLTDDFVATVFRHVLRDENPPARLSDLVIRTLGEGMDTKLWAQLQCMVGKDTAHRLIEIMLASKTVKPERAFEEASSIKCEEVYTSPTG